MIVFGSSRGQAQCRPEGLGSAAGAAQRAAALDVCPFSILLGWGSGNTTRYGPHNEGSKEIYRDYDPPYRTRDKIVLE